MLRKPGDEDVEAGHNPLRHFVEHPAHVPETEEPGVGARQGGGNVGAGGEARLGEVAVDLAGGG